MVKRRRVAHKPKPQPVQPPPEPEPVVEEREPTPPPAPSISSSPEPVVESMEVPESILPDLEPPISSPELQLTFPVQLAPDARLQVARTRLSGILNRAAKKPGHDSESEEDVKPPPPVPRTASPDSGSGAQGSPMPGTPLVTVKIEGSSSRSSIKSGHRSSSRRKKRTVAPVTDSAFHHTYVMKLFDRSVDLAQFRESTSLYPVCRAWMANQPRNPNLLPKRRTPTPEPPASDEELPPPAEEEEEETKDSDDDMKDVYKMPGPRNTRKKNRGPLHHTWRVPSPIEHEITEVVINEEAGPTGLDEKILLREHVEHWRNVKAKWMQAGRRNEDRYKESIDIIEDIYKKAQEMYA